MEIVVISDTHRNTEVMALVRKRHPNASFYIHCGDSELPSYLLDGFTSVKGNCDHYEDYPRYLAFHSECGLIYVEHGEHLSAEYIASKNARLFLCGHSHMHGVRKIKNTYIANPGSLTKPRDGDIGTYLVIEMTQTNIDFKFLTLE